MTAYSRLAPIWITAALLIFAPSAQALIQVDAGIAGARLGATRDQVRAALGKPIKIRTLKNDFGPYVEYSLLRRHPRDVPGQGQRQRRQHHRQERLHHGRDRRRLDREPGAGLDQGVKCEGVGTARSCHTGEFKPGKTVTDFRIENGNVTSVTVGIVID